MLLDWIYYGLSDGINLLKWLMSYDTREGQQLRLEQSDKYFVEEDLFTNRFLNNDYGLLFQMSLKFGPKDLINELVYVTYKCIEVSIYFPSRLHG